LLIARADQGRVTVQPVVCNLAAVVREIVEDFRLLAVEDGRRLVLEAPEACCVTADHRHLRQVIHNLLTNAFKHGRSDLAVRVKPLRSRRSVVIANRIPHASSSAQVTLGLGLRVVAALLRLDPAICFQRRRGTEYYVVRLSFPASNASPADATASPALA
jgi:signal transduction histidine kinase